MSDGKQIKIQVLAKPSCRNPEDLAQLATELESSGIQVLAIGAASIAAQVKPDIFTSMFRPASSHERSLESRPADEAVPDLTIPPKWAHVVDNISVPGRHIQMDQE